MLRPSYDPRCGGVWNWPWHCTSPCSVDTPDWGVGAGRAWGGHRMLLGENLAPDVTRSWGMPCLWISCSQNPLVCSVKRVPWPAGKVPMRIHSSACLLDCSGYSRASCLPSDLPMVCWFHTSGLQTPQQNTNSTMTVVQSKLVYEPGRRLGYQGPRSGTHVGPVTCDKFARTTHTDLNILQINVDGLQHKSTELNKTLTDNNVHIALLQETVLPKHKVSTPGYTQVLCECQQRCRGVMTLIRNDVQAETTNVPVGDVDVQKTKVWLGKNLYSLFLPSFLIPSFLIPSLPLAAGHHHNTKHIPGRSTGDSQHAHPVGTLCLSLYHTLSTLVLCSV